ncbi:Mitochondrial basic amino acids transporter [Sciurus carolinensis]|uniref:Mitochondrial basic amino acids transporter n=2 Tax=Sciurus carolinensis TaxID=30640 RepID=A0AA41N529_SCICA|nr:Mitochondrial basic amino acids transporter [Sciurus carolinensis]
MAALAPASANSGPPTPLGLLGTPAREPSVPLTYSFNKHFLTPLALSPGQPSVCSQPPILSPGEMQLRGVEVAPVSFVRLAGRAMLDLMAAHGTGTGRHRGLTEREVMGESGVVAGWTDAGMDRQVRLQVQNVEKPQYRGTLHCFQSIVKQESVLGLYKGLGSPLMGLTFINALVFGVQGNTLRALGQDSPLNQFLAGAAAGAIQCVICCPMELAKTRLQLQDAGLARTYKGSLDCLVQIYRREGVRGVNRGMVSTLLRETPSFGVYFLTYDVLTRALGCEPGDHLLVPKLLLAGGTSGIMSWLSTYPVDVVKSRLQADGLRGAPRYRGILDCMRQSYQAEGWRVFTRGLTSTLLRAFPVNAATFATVTVVLSYARGEEAGPEGEANPAAPSGPALAQPSSL